MTGTTLLAYVSTHPDCSSPTPTNHQNSFSPSLPLSLTMLKRQRPSSPLPIPTTYGDDLSSSSAAFHPATNMNIHTDLPFVTSRKRLRVSPDILPGAPGVGSSGSVGRHTFLSSSVLSKRRRSPDSMDDGDDSDGDSGSRPGPQFSNTSSDYQRERETSDPFVSRPTINLKRPRMSPPVLEGTSRGWGPDQPSYTGTGPNIPNPTLYPFSSFDPTNPPPGWVLETQVGEYAQENARLHDLHALRPRFPHTEEVTQEPNEIANVDVDMEEKVVKERYEERNKYVLLPP